MMRYEDKVKWLSGALVVLLLVWGLGEFFSPERVAARTETGTLLANKADAAADIMVSVGTSSLHLQKNGGLWQVMDGGDALPAQASRVDAFLSALAKSGHRRPVAKAADAWKNLGLDEAQAKSLKIADAKGRVLLDLKAGNRGPTGSGLYVRFASSNDSWLIDADISSWLVADRGSWLDLRVWRDQLGSDKVQSASATADVDFGAQAAAPSGSAAAKKAPAHRVSWSFERVADGWKGGSPAPDAVTVESMLRAALNLEAVDLAAHAPAGAFDKIVATLTLSLGTGATRVVEVGAPASDGRYWVRTSDNGQASALSYQVSTWSLASIFKDAAAFGKKAP